MKSPRRRDPVASDTISPPVLSQDRFARTDGRSQRSQPLTRTIEVAHLLPDQTCETSVHRVPRTAIYEETAAAFARGTLVQTVDGPVAVEDLLAGDHVETSCGVQAIVWIGTTPLSSFGSGAAGSSLTHLTRIPTDTFGPGRPGTDLVLGPAARIKHAPQTIEDEVRVEGVLSPVKDFTDGMGVFEVTPPSPVQVYHLAFRRHAVFSASGLEVESYHPGMDLGARLGPNGLMLFLSLFPHLAALEDFGPLSLRRMSRDCLDDLTAARSGPRPSG